MRREDEEEYAAFFRAEYPAILRAMYLMTGDRAQAEDVTQDAFAALFAHWRKVSRYEKPGAWVRVVALRMARRAARRERRRANLESVAGEPSPNSASHMDLRHAVLTLSESQRTAVILHYFEGRPVEEMASIMGCSAGTAKTHLHRARLHLAARLGEEAPDVAG